MPLKIEQHDDGTVTIAGTHYAPDLFENLSCGFPAMVGQVLRIDKKKDGIVTVTRLRYLELGREKDLLTEFSKYLLANWTVEKYWDGEPCERATDPVSLVEEFLKRFTLPGRPAPDIE